MLLRRLPRLQEFRFADRTSELDQVSVFVSRLLNGFEPNLMWVRGKAKVGVSRFLREVEASLGIKPALTVHRIVIGDGLDADEKSLRSLTTMLGGEHSGVLERFAENYSAGTALSTAASIMPASPVALGTAVFVEAVLSGAKVLERGALRDPYQVICDLIRQAPRSGGRRLVLIVDQLDNAGPNLLGCLINVMSEFSGDDSIRFIVSTSAGHESGRLLDTLRFRFDIDELLIEPFDSHAYFFDILTDFFGDISAGEESVKRLGDLCGYSAGVLRDRLREYFSSGSCDGGIADFFAFVCEGEASTLGVFEDAYMQVVSHCDAPISESRITGLVQSVLTTMFMMPDSSVIAGELYKARIVLGKSGMLAYANGVDGEEPLVVTSQSALSGTNGARADQNMKQRISDVVRSMEDSEWRETFPQSDRREMEARLSYEAKDADAGKLNLECALALIDAGRPIDALRSIERYLGTNPAPGPDEQGALMAFAEACYRDGRYRDARSLLDMIVSDDDSDFERAFLQGKVCNVLHDLEGAEERLLTAQAAARNDNEAVMAKSMRQLVLIEVQGRREDAFRLFDEIYDSIEGKDVWSAEECMAMRTVVDFPHGRFDIDGILDKAYRQARDLPDRLPLAYICMARGLQSMRAGDTIEACSLFNEGREVLAALRPHEQAYAYNNMGLCKMVDGDDDGAVALLRQGLSWGASNFIRTALTSNLAIALALQGRDDSRSHLPAMEAALRNPSALVRNRVSHAICFVLLASGAMEPRAPVDISSALFDSCLENLVDTPADDIAKRTRVDAYLAWRDEPSAAFLDYCRSCGKTYYEVAFQPWVSTLHHD